MSDYIAQAENNVGVWLLAWVIVLAGLWVLADYNGSLAVTLAIAILFIMLIRKQRS